MNDEAMVPISELSAALDEIYTLRALVAIQTVELADVLRYRTLPHNAKGTITAVISRLMLASKGGARLVPYGTDMRKLSLREVGAPETYVRSDLQREIAQRREDGDLR